MDRSSRTTRPAKEMVPMKMRIAVMAATAALAGAAVADDASAAHRTMHEAMEEQADMPRHGAAMPDQATPGTVAGHAQHEKAHHAAEAAMPGERHQHMKGMGANHAAAANKAAMGAAMGGGPNGGAGGAKAPGMMGGGTNKPGMMGGGAGDMDGAAMQQQMKGMHPGGMMGGGSGGGMMPGGGAMPGSTPDTGGGMGPGGAGMPGATPGSGPMPTTPAQATPAASPAPATSPMNGSHK